VKSHHCHVIAHDDGATASASATATSSTVEPVTPVQESAVDVAAKKEQSIANGSSARDFFHWQPKNLLQENMMDKSNPDAQAKLFHHITNHTTQMMWNSKNNLEPSAYLDANVSDDQRELLAPTCRNTLQGFIMCDVKGKGAQNKLAKRRLDVISGNASSYSRCMNDPKHLKQIKEVNKLAATVAEVTADIDNEKKQNAAKKAQMVNATKEKKVTKIAEEEAEHAVELPKLKPLMEDFETEHRDVACLNTTLFPKPFRTKTLKHCHNAKPTGAQKKSKQETHQEVMTCFEAGKLVIPI